MANRPDLDDVLERWLGIPGRLELAVAGLDERQLDDRGAKAGMSLRETVHHLVEANLIASNIIVAALATDGTTFDWSWVYPSGDWMKRMGYDRAPVRPAIEALRALGQHLANVIRSAPRVEDRSVRLLDAPGAKLYAKNVVEILEQEIAHAHQHLTEAERARKGHGG